MVFATLKRCRCRRQIRQELRALLGARPPERLSAQSAESAFSRRETGPSGEESVYSEGAPGGGVDDVGVSENSVPLNPLVNDHYPY